MIFEDLVQLEMGERKNTKDKEVSFNETSFSKGLEEVIGQSYIDKLSRHDRNYDYIFDTNDEYYRWKSEVFTDEVGSIDVYNKVGLLNEPYYDEYINTWILNGQEIEDEELIRKLNYEKELEEGGWD